jgi:hypothetical protein
VTDPTTALTADQIARNKREAEAERLLRALTEPLPPLSTMPFTEDDNDPALVAWREDNRQHHKRHMKALDDTATFLAAATPEEGWKPPLNLGPNEIHAGWPGPSRAATPEHVAGMHTEPPEREPDPQPYDHGDGTL